LPDVWTASERVFEEVCVAKISLLPTQWPSFLAQLSATAARLGVRWRIVGQPIGVGLVGMQSDDPGRLVELLRAARAALAAIDGSLTIHRAPPEVKRAIDVWPAIGTALPLMRRIKAQFDPNETLAPGRFVGGI
jgi:glycolate oxidase FAD binding subunit